MAPGSLSSISPRSHLCLVQGEDTAMPCPCQGPCEAAVEPRFWCSGLGTCPGRASSPWARWHHGELTLCPEHKGYFPVPPPQSHPEPCPVAPRSSQTYPKIRIHC